MSKEKMVCVEWEDAMYNSGYYDKKSPEEFTPTLTRTVGHLVKRTGEAILVAQDRFYDSKGKPGDDRHIGVIPKKMIKKVTILGDVSATHKEG